MQQTTGRVTVTDFDPALLADAESRVNSHWPMNIRRHDWVTDGPIPEGFDAAFGLDVLEHIDPTDETVFLSNIAASMLPSGVCIMGMPSLESQTYASPQSREGHVNCKSGKDLRDTMSQFFETVFVFSMNDEVVHTGFFPMAQYLLAVGSHPRH